MALARRAASRDPDARGDFFAAMDHANEVVRYWAAIGLLLADPLLAMLKVALVRRSEANSAMQAAEEAEKARSGAA